MSLLDRVFLVKHLCYSERPWYIGLDILQRLPLTRALDCEGFFLSVQSWVFVDVNQLFPWFSHAPMQTEKVPSSLNDGRRLTRIISNDDGVFTISLR